MLYVVDIPGKGKVELTKKEIYELVKNLQEPVKQIKIDEEKGIKQVLLEKFSMSIKEGNLDGALMFIYNNERKAKDEEDENQKKEYLDEARIVEEMVKESDIVNDPQKLDSYRERIEANVCTGDEDMFHRRVSVLIRFYPSDRLVYEAQHSYNYKEAAKIELAKRGVNLDENPGGHGDR